MNLEEVDETIKKLKRAKRVARIARPGTGGGFETNMLLHNDRADHPVRLFWHVEKNYR
jgi:hypothetical protein